MIDKGTIWSEAAKAGLLLGAFTSAFIFINMLTSSFATASVGARFAGFILNTALWLVKFIGCLWLLRFFMLRFVSERPEATGRDSFRFGVVVALTSALIVAGASLLNINLSQETYQETVNTVMQSYLGAAGITDSERVAIEHMMGSLPTISFFMTLIYCFLFGVAASGIFSRSIPPEDIFKDTSNGTDSPTGDE